MINKIKYVLVKNDYFEPGCLLKLYDKKDSRFTVIHGKNGSGKSSISRLIYEYSKDQLLSEEQCQFLDEENKILSFDKNKIYVYGENFIEKEVRFSSNESLNAIIMLGQQVDIDSQLAQKNDELKSYISIDLSLNKELEKYTLDNGEKNPNTYNEKITKVIKNGWAIRERDIRNLKKLPSVKPEFYTEILEYKNSDNISTLNKKFKDYKKIYNEISSVNKISIFVKKAIFDEEHFFNILNRNLTKPLSNKQIDLINSVIESYGFTFIDITKNLIEKNRDICPICYQKIEKNHLHNLNSNIESVLNKELSEYKKELESICLELENYDLTEYYGLFPEDVKKIQEAILVVNENLQEYEKFLNEKNNNPYNDEKYVTNNYYDNKETLDKLLDNLLSKIIEHNNNVDNKEKIYNLLIELNKKISYLEIKDEVNNLILINEELEMLKNKIRKNADEINKIKLKCDELRSKKNNINIAFRKINDYLKIIFYDDERLKIEIFENEYRILVRKKNISLNLLSQGEKNAISLCYFFVKMLENCTESNEYQNEYFIVLDDPISSFDIENKIGIYSLMRYVFSKVKTNNPNSKILFFTHKLDVYFDMCKIYSDIDKKCCEQSILLNKSINYVEKKPKNDYSKLLKIIFAYADNKNSDMYEMSIGNIMRRVLEAYFSFNYNNGFENALNKSEILNKIQDEEKKKYFENFMYRLVLHTESHTEERAYNFAETKMFDYISSDEKIITAKNVLILLYLLDPSHLKLHELDVKKIVQWEEQLFKKEEVA